MQYKLEKNQVEREVLLRGLEDYVGIWEVISVVHDVLLQDDEASVRGTVIKVLSALMQDKMMRPGFPTYSGGFEALDEDPVRTLARIEREWDELGREPDVGDIVWFDLTEKGEDYLKKLPAA